MTHPLEQGFTARSPYLKDDELADINPRFLYRPRTDQELSDRHARYLAWQKLTDELLAEDILDYDHCYECEGTLVEATEDINPSRHKYETVENPDYDPDREADGSPVEPYIPTITFTAGPKRNYFTGIGQDVEGVSE